MNLISSIIFAILGIAELIGFLATGMAHCGVAALILFALTYVFAKLSKHKPHGIFHNN